MYTIAAKERGPPYVMVGALSKGCPDICRMICLSGGGTKVVSVCGRQTCLYTLSWLI